MNPYLTIARELIPIIRIGIDFFNSFSAVNGRAPTPEEIENAIATTEDEEAKWALNLQEKRMNPPA